ncbi:sulfotransferase [Rubinisphaera italica]|uniref:Uncharacterized protein n=1 Tax=Rubinisphaera italica TaxID=2527969 RepID=A0A5C5XJZ8_9PLAN|nr:sulfotransferase [Rubinisphaera italica]TWT63174.1 hypothetical protein Pan54_39270 [Rubinisphaera italica]
MKLFGIGTNKTGTVSMKYAFEAAGLRVLHDWAAGQIIVDDLQAGRVPAALEKYDIFVDGPYIDCADLILDAVPDAKLLYQWRPLNDFICSSLMHILDNRLNKPNGHWMSLDTDQLERHWHRTQVVAQKALSLAPDRVAEYQLGDNRSWRAAMNKLGYNQVGELPNYHRSLDRIAGIEAHYLDRKPISDTPVVLAVRSMNHWETGINNIPKNVDTPEIRQRIEEWWPKNFEMPFTEYRARLAQIARTNWSKCPGIDSQICIQSWEVERFANAIVIPIDDDDWLVPEIVSIVRQNLSESTHAVCWQVDRVATVGNGNYASWLNGERNRFATNGYALAPRYRDLCQGREYRLAAHCHLAAARPDATVVELPQILGIAPRTFAAGSFLNKVRSQDELISLARKAKADHEMHETALRLGATFQEEFYLLAHANRALFETLKV